MTDKPSAREQSGTIAEIVPFLSFKLPNLARKYL